MKRETFRHPKTLDLASRLGCSRPEAIGYLNLLWDFTAEYAIQGDIGKHANGAIARACDYSGDPDKFVAALVDAHWVDVDPDYRLLVHDWSEHCERWVKLKAEKLSKSFIESFAKRSVKPSIEQPVIDITEPSPYVTNPIQSKPNQPEDLSGLPDPDPPKVEKTTNAEFKTQAREVLQFLNTKTGRNYQPVEANLETLVARLREGFTQTQLRQVIAKKCRDWEKDEKMEPYLRPKTLFNRTNFANYVGELEVIHEQE